MEVYPHEPVVPKPREWDHTLIMQLADGSGPERMSHSLTFSIIALVALLSVAMLAYARPFGKKPSRVEPVGSFEILTYETGVTRGWNEGRLRRDVTETYAIRHRGKPYRFVGKAGLFRDEEREYDEMNSVITFPSPEPVIVVNVGDPNNRSFFYLLREVDGRATATLLGETSGNISADWLDPAPGTAPSERELALHRAHREGGRLLLLGNFTVLDTETLASWQVTPTMSPALHRPPLALSPDRRSFVRASADQVFALLVYDFIGGEAYSLPIDRSVMRYNVREEVDAVWVAHHFEWKRNEAGHDRLVRRESFEPLPRKGTLKVDPSDGYRSYRIQPVSSEMQEVVVSYLEQTMNGARQPRGQYSTSDQVLVGGRMINVMHSGDYVGLWMDRGSDSTFVEEIARAIDKELAAGRWSEHFTD